MRLLENDFLLVIVCTSPKSVYQFRHYYNCDQLGQILSTVMMINIIIHRHGEMISRYNI